MQVALANILWRRTKKRRMTGRSGEPGLPIDDWRIRFQGGGHGVLGSLRHRQLTDVGHGA